MVKINFIGDVALFKEFQVKSIDPFRNISLPVSDYNIGNFEFVIPNKREKRYFDVLDKYSIDYDYFNSLNLEVFDAFGVANNHSMDYGQEGSEDMLSVLKKHGIPYFGIGYGDFNIHKFELEGVLFAIIAVVKAGRWSRSNENLYGPDPYDTDKIIEKIKLLKKEVDHVIVFPHFGTELVDIPDPSDVTNSRLMIDSGASAVIGHHPHIIQGVEKYNNGIIAYSLGSFIYISENEQGYKANQCYERAFSLCMNLVFNKDCIIEANAVYYKFDEKLRVPVIYTGSCEYFEKINGLIDNSKEYYNSVRRVLLKREIVSFCQRLRENPISTIKHYVSYLKLKHIKKFLHK